MNEEQLYINFDEYIRQGEPTQRKAAYAWSTAIGLQAVDGLKTSDYLNELARKNIEGEITIDDVDRLLHNYYENKVIDYTPVYLERFFRNLLFGEQWDLRNRYLHIHPTEEWRNQPNLSLQTSTLKQK